MVAYAARVGEFELALDFLFTPDFSQLNAHIVMAAFGQAFFSVSVGLTSMMAYGAYIQKSTSIPRSALIIVLADTAVALLAGLAIFPIIFLYKCNWVLYIKRNFSILILSTLFRHL